MASRIDSPEVGVAAIAAVVVLCLASITSLYVQTWWPMVVAAVLIGGIVLTVGAFVAFTDRAWRPLRTWQCVHCRYDRRGLPPTAACPECGRAAGDDRAGRR